MGYDEHEVMRALGAIEGRLDGIHEGICDIRANQKGYSERLRRMEIRSGGLGALGGALTLLILKLKTITGG